MTDSNPKGKSPYARRQKRAYDYGHLFADCPEHQRALRSSQFTAQLRRPEFPRPYGNHGAPEWNEPRDR